MRRTDKSNSYAYGREHNDRLTALIQDIMGEPAPELPMYQPRCPQILHTHAQPSLPILYI